MKGFQCFVRVVYSIANNISKAELERISDSDTRLLDIPLVQIYSLPPSAFNLRTLAAKLGYVKISDKLQCVEKCCEMLGFEIPKWGFQKDIILWAKHCGFRNAERYSAAKSCEYLGIQRYPRSLRELSLVDVDRYNHDVEGIRASLREVIRDMRPRTKLVKYRTIILFKEDYGITENDNFSRTSPQRLNEIIEKYNL